MEIVGGKKWYEFTATVQEVWAWCQPLSMKYKFVLEMKVRKANGSDRNVPMEDGQI